VRDSPGRVFLLGIAGGRFGLAAWLLDRETGQLRGEGVGRVRGERQFQQRHGGDVETGRPRAAVDQHGDGDRDGAEAADDVDALDDAPPAGDDILDDQDSLARREAEAPAQDEDIVFR
jgi:hypothetical protein